MADLIDRYALLLKQKEHADLFADSTVHDDIVRRDEATAALAEIINAPSINRWISIEDALPEIDIDVIVYYPYWNDKPIQVAHLAYDKLTFELSDGEFNFPTSALTHWMKLPEPPEKG